MTDFGISGGEFMHSVTRNLAVLLEEVKCESTAGSSCKITDIYAF